MQVLESFTYIGPNRRADECVIEKLIELTTAEREALSARAADYCGQLRAALQTNGIPANLDALSNSTLVGDTPGVFAYLYAGTALAIQHAAGHKVNFATTLSDPNPNRKRVVFEYEQEDVGHRADTLALSLLASVIPELNWTDRPLDQAGSFAEMFAEFKDFARPFILPADTQAIIDAAARLDIPCVKLEREPYKGLTGDFRIRQNGLLKLGHSVYQQIVDGTFCVDKGQHLMPLIMDRERMFQRLTELQAPVALQDNEFRNCMTVRRAARSAASIGYPVVVKPRLRSHGRGISLNIPDAEALRIAVEKAQQHSRKVMIEKFIAGKTFKVIVANRNVIGVVSDGHIGDLSSMTHPSTLHMVLNLAEEMGTGMLVADVVTSEIGLPLQQLGGAVVDLDLVPELDRFLPAGSQLHATAMSGLVQWLYPEGAKSRIPTVAVTGTNGKTTTSRMIANIMQAGHFHTGLACTDGIYINGEQVKKGDSSGRGRHHRLFESRKVNFGVFETARGALAYSGFMFDWCNVSVCLNITEDHLGEYGIDTLDQMAELKRSVLERARDAAVLNADDERCIGMLPFLSASRNCLISMESGVGKLAEIPGSANCFSVLENIDGSSWLVLYDDGQRMPVIEAEQIPATFGGSAGFNISNALHAIAACYLLGTDPELIRKGLRSFSMGFETTPGRLNVYDGLPFRVIMDYAHNADGFRKLSAFVDRQQSSGRKIVMVAVAGNHMDEHVMAAAAELAGHFNHYVCRNYTGTRGRSPEEIPSLLKSGLCAAGVSDNAVTTIPDAAEAIQFCLNMAGSGDLLVLLPGNDEFESTWKQITAFGTIDEKQTRSIRTPFASQDIEH